MNSITLLLTLLSIASVATAEEYPVPPPTLNGGIPFWWGDIWSGHVVVLEGTIKVVEDGKPDVSVSIDPEAAETFFTVDDRDLEEYVSKFYLGRVQPKRLLFASPGIISNDGNIASIEAGRLTELKILIPASKSGEKFRITTGGKNGEEGVFIFRYGSGLVTVPLIFERPIPKDGLESAQVVFEYRSRFDQFRNDNQKPEQDATEQPVTAGESK